MRTLIYARYSSQLQNSRSIEDQIRVCTERVETEGWSVVGVHVDAAISGAAGMEQGQRPGLNALLHQAEAGGIDQVLAETMSRIARHEGDSFAIRDRLKYARVRLFTLSDGEIDDFKGSIRGLLDAHQRKDLAANIKRGQRGAVAQGRAPAGLAYGYRTANTISDRGTLERGLREIDEDQAVIVRRIFAEYAARQSARQIAERLNGERVPGPRGGLWRTSVITANPKRGDGMLINRIYIGELIHNRTSKIVEPRTRAVKIRANPESEWMIQPVPELRIVDQAVWESVQAQIAERRTVQTGTPTAYQRRPPRLLSGLGRCGLCGEGWKIFSSDRWGCAGHRNGAGCVNNRSIGTDRYEDLVLRALRERLLDPEAVALFVREYHLESARREKEDARERGTLERRRAEAERKIARLVNAIGEGMGDIPEIRMALTEAREARDRFAADLEAIESHRVIALHPRVADDYRRRVEELQALAEDPSPEAQTEAIPRLRGLIDSVILTPANSIRGVDIEVTGHLARMIELATGRGPPEGVTLLMERVKGIEPS